MYNLFRPLLFTLEPEQAHNLSLAAMRMVGRFAPLRAAMRNLFAAAEEPVHAFGLTFRNPVGLAAGYDKDGLAWRGLACLGFGHIEVGTVTPRPQDGNPRPRLFRLPEDRALINRMGFPGRGADFVRQQLTGERPPGLILGVNLGVNKDTQLERAADDYLVLIDIFAPLADYLVINVSSPNTLGLRRLQARQALETLLRALTTRRKEISRATGNYIPLLVKLAPDLNSGELDDALEAILHFNLDGVIAANTTVSRDRLRSPLAVETGGLSGAPLRKLSTQMIRQIAKYTGGKLVIVGAGGVMSANDAHQMLDAGAVLVQVYTGLVYEGPSLVKKIIAAI